MDTKEKGVVNADKLEYAHELEVCMDLFVKKDKDYLKEFLEEGEARFKRLPN